MTIKQFSMKFFLNTVKLIHYLSVDVSTQQKIITRQKICIHLHFTWDGLVLRMFSDNFIQCTLLEMSVQQ